VGRHSYLPRPSLGTLGKVKWSGAFTMTTALAPRELITAEEYPQLPDDRRRTELRRGVVV